jgi:serine/threonine protein kinase
MPAERPEPVRLFLIGVGGMGEVHKATDPKIGRDVAIKVLPADFSADKERVARLNRKPRRPAP